MRRLAYRATVTALLGASVLVVNLTLLSVAGNAQSLGAVAKKEKKRRAENESKDVPVIDDRALANASGDGFSVTGVTTESASQDEDSPPPPATTTEPDEGASACRELRAVETQIANLKKQPQTTTVERRRGTRAVRGVITGVDSQGNVTTSSYEATRTTPKRTISHVAERSAELAELKSRWAELRARCSE